LSVGGVVNDTWTGWSVDSDLLTPADAFELELFTRSGITLPATVVEGAPCTLDLDGDAVLTGTLDEVEHQVGRRGHAVRITGRDKAGTLVDCSSPFVAMREATLQQIIDQVVKPMGISKVRLDSDIAKLRKQVQVSPGQTAWEALLLTAEANGLWPWVDPDGTLVVGGPDYAAATVGDLVMRQGDSDDNNIEDMSVRRSIADRYSQITVLGQHGAYQGSGWGEDRTTLAAKVSDSALTARGIFRPRVVIDSGCDTSDLARDRVDKLLSDSKLDAFEARVKVKGWRASGGAVWTPGQRVNLISEPHGINGTYFLMARTLRLTRREGATTELRFREDKTWIVNAHQNKQKKQKKPTEYFGL
jgi:prophage tail gpP-like protein